MDKNKYFSFLGTMAAGLEDIASREITEKLAGAYIYKILRGKVIFKSNSCVQELLELKCLDNIYFYIGDFKIGPHKSDLSDLAQKIRDLDISSALAYYPLKMKKAYAIVSASRSGKHTYSRFDLADAALVAVLERYDFGAGDNNRHDYAFRLDVEDDNATFALKLTSAQWRFRGTDRQFAPGALRPSIAHALVYMSEPGREDLFLDPFCGSGTIACERALYSAALIMAGDISPEAVEATSNNLPKGVEVYCGDACNTGIKAKSINKIVTNLPWDIQIKVEDLQKLYIDFFEEVKRIADDNCQTFVLTDKEEMIQKAAEENGMACQKLCTISLHGCLPSVYKINL